MEIKISTNDLVGKIFIKLPSFNMDDYFKTVKLLKSLRDEIDKKLTGFYISCIALPYNGPPFNFVTVRITYFTSNKNESRKKIIKFLEKNKLTLLSEYEKKPNKEELYKDYGGTELRFKRFLFLQTLIGLDLICSDIFFSPQGKEEYKKTIFPRIILEPIFKQYSETYTNLSQDLEEQLWKDFELSGYAHMFENMMQLKS